MNLNKHDPMTEMEMDMTPMIDVVFLLIIFFMVITDMTQADLEDLKLPVAQNATADKPNPDEFRPIVNIKIDGSILVKRELLFDPENEDDYKVLREYLSDVARRMKKEKASGLPDEPLLIRADENTSFKHIQKVMEQCGYAGIQIWKVQLAAAEAKKDKP
ncbi:MAG: biopolymer transporter ExbD [bacterium]|jgi:biopolymer transport protein ExbD|nr:biopolymer transporter ExbD [Planctomycetota bacterium]HIL51379.1 biopolymer transporter ExbD [Planctomycetota bacterium]